MKSTLIIRPHRRIVPCFYTNMQSHLQSTIFGQLMRFLSGGKVFQYPDEIDPSIWERAVKTETREDNTVDEQSAKEAQGCTAIGEQIGGDGGQRILLVGWYGPNDPEVRTPVVSLMLLLSTSLLTWAIHSRTPRTGPVPSRISSLSKCVFSTLPYILQARSTLLENPI